MARRLAQYLKAFAAAVTAFAVPYAGALTATSDQGSAVTQGEWTTAIVAGLVGGFTVAAVPNAKKKPKGNAGYGALELLVAVLVVVILVLLILRLA